LGMEKLILNISVTAWQLYLLCYTGSKFSYVHISSNIRLSVSFTCSFCLQLKFVAFTLHYTTLHHTTLHYITLHYTLHYTTLHNITLHYTTHYTTLHYNTLHYISAVGCSPIF
jgi:hypothetical protein